MDFSKYIGKKKGKSPGANAVSKYYDRVRKNVFSKITTDKTKEDLKELEDFLNNMFFPKENKESMDRTQTFFNTLIKGYNLVYDKKISTGMQIDKSNTYMDASKVKKLLWSKNSANENITNRSLDVINKHLQDIYSLINNLKGTDGGNLLTKEMNSLLNNKIPQLNNAINTFINCYKNDSGDFDPGWEAVRKKMIISSDRGAKNLLPELQEFERFYKTVRNTYCATPGMIGDVFEYGLALLSSDWKQLRDTTEEKAFKTIAEEIKKTKVMGNKNVNRSDNSLKMNFDVAYSDVTQIGDSSILKTQDNGKTIEIIKIGNLEFTYNNNIDVGSSKQGKMDVVFSIPSVANGKVFRISAKNWESINNASEKLGTTSILAGVTRTLGTSGSNNYIYTLQHPIPSAGDAILSKTHEIAKIALLLDIVMGYSQKSGYADTLVIMDRREKHIYVKDIISMMKEIIDNSTLSSKAPLRISNYNETEIEENARFLRQTVMNYVSKNNQRSATYLSLMRMYLNSIKVSVHLNNLTK